MTAHDTQKKAFIRDDALVLYFDTAENPVVARFDLNSLVQANFEVTKKEPFYALILRDFSGSQQDIAQFSSKSDAHQALYAILQALLEQNEKDTSHGGAKRCCKKSSWIVCLIKWALMLIGVVSVLYVGLLYVTAGPGVSHDTAAAVTSSNAPVSTAPEGEAVDLDSILPETLPQTAPNVTE